MVALVASTCTPGLGFWESTRVFLQPNNLLKIRPCRSWCGVDAAAPAGSSAPGSPRLGLVLLVEASPDLGVEKYRSAAQKYICEL
jgi:hypothetical protein